MALVFRGLIGLIQKEMDNFFLYMDSACWLYDFEK